MADKVLQCCYTNASQEVGGVLSSGWKAVSFSDNLPTDAYNKCVECQGINSTIDSIKLDEHGNDLDLYELVGDGNYLYVMRSKYGSTDRLGRPNMFSHAYILEWNEECLTDPNYFLTITNDNFTDNEEAAGTIRTSFMRGIGYELKSSLAKLGMNAEKYATLIQCIYAQMSENKTKKPLYVQYNGEEEQMKELLYCIYYGLPNYMKKSLCVASCPSANKPDNKNVIFSVKANEYENYINPLTGENNVLTQRVIRKIERFRFIDYAAKNYETINISMYFTQLDQLAIALGDTNAKSDLVLKMAHLILNNRLEPLDDGDNEEIESRLSDALRTGFYGNENMEDYIKKLLNRICSRDMVLTKENELTLADWFAKAGTKELVDAIEKYNLKEFAKLSAQDGAAKLAMFSQDDFNRYRQMLVTNEKGQQILDQYYGENVYEKATLTWEYVNKVYTESKDLPVRTKTTDGIQSKAWKLYCDDLAVDAVLAYKKYNALMQYVVSPSSINSCMYSAKETYWERQNFYSFSFGKFREYEQFKLETNMKCKLFTKLLSVLGSFKRTDDSALLSDLCKYFNDNKVELTDSDKEIIVDKIAEDIKKDYAIDTTVLKSWMGLLVFVKDLELLTLLLIIKMRLKEKKYKDVTNAFNKVVKGYNSLPEYKLFCSRLRDLMLDICKIQDSEDNPVPLDLWLLLSALRPRNSFELFDDIKPVILIMDEFDIVEDSKLLSLPRYYNDAEEYISNKGSEAKNVKRWVGALKQMEKQSKKEQGKAEKQLEKERKAEEKMLKAREKEMAKERRYEEPDRREVRRSERTDSRDYGFDVEIKKVRPDSGKDSNLFSKLFGRK